MSLDIDAMASRAAKPLTSPTFVVRQWLRVMRFRLHVWSRKQVCRVVSHNFVAFSYNAATCQRERYCWRCNTFIGDR